MRLRMAKSWLMVDGKQVGAHSGHGRASRGQDRQAAADRVLPVAAVEV